MGQPSAPPFWRRLPSIAWIVIFVVGIFALIGGIIGLFWLLINVEGAASVIMLLAAWGTIRGVHFVDVPSKYQSLMTAIGLTFFALMGLAIDQTGNMIYNKPIEWFFCPADSELKRGIDVTNPVPGQTNVSQEFTCVKPNSEQLVETVRTGNVMAVRFGEYILIGYILIWINRLYLRLRRDRSAEAF